MKVFIVTHDQGVDGGRAVGVFASTVGAIAFVEKQKERYPSLRRQNGTELFWDSLGDSFYIDEFEVEA